MLYTVLRSWCQWGKPQPTKAGEGKKTNKKPKQTIYLYLCLISSSVQLENWSRKSKWISCTILQPYVMAWQGSEPVLLQQINHRTIISLPQRPTRSLWKPDAIPGCAVVLEKAEGGCALPCSWQQGLCLQHGQQMLAEAALLSGFKSVWEIPGSGSLWSGDYKTVISISQLELR